MSRIIGIGIDIEETSRIADATERWSADFLQKIFTEAEIAYCQGKAKPAEHFTARFAAKEAFSKAIGTGWRGSFHWKHCEIWNDDNGKPGIRLFEEMQDHFGNLSIFLSISHTHAYAAAMVIIQDEM
jgi:holo-[acyl-carrier protein] synthase